MSIIDRESETVWLIISEAAAGTNSRGTSGIFSDAVGTSGILSGAVGTSGIFNVVVRGLRIFF